jgi:sulfur-carrier protein
MPVNVKLFATLREGRGKVLEMDLDENTTPGMIIDHLDIRREDVAILLVNGKDANFDQKLQDGDNLSIFPPVGGG